MKLTLKLFLAILGVAVASLAVVAVLVYSSVRGALERQINTNQLEVAKQTINKSDRFLYARLIDISGLVQQDQLRHFITTRVTTATAATAQQSLEDYRGLSANWRELSILDLNGKVQAATDKTDLGTVLLTQNASLPGLYDQARRGAVVYSNAIRLSDDAAPTVVYFAPIHNGNAVVGVAEGEIAWPSLLDVLQGINGPTTYLLNSQGLLLGSNLSTPADQLLTKSYAQAASFKAAQHGSSGTTVVATLANAKASGLMAHITETGFRDFHGNGWILLLETPTSTAYAPAEQLTFYLLAGFLVTVLLGIGIIILMINRQILRPVRALSGAVTRVTLGDLTQTVPVATQDELGMLGRNFNEMTYQLAATHRNLQASTHEAEEGRAQLESSINGLRQGFILTDLKGQGIMFNSAAQDMITQNGHPAKGVKTNRLTTMISLLPAELKLPDEIAHTIKTGKPAKFPAVPLAGRFLNLYLSPVTHAKETIGCVLLLEDITEERIMQRSRDEFFSIASHELRTPLTAIRGNTSMIQQYFGDVLKDVSLAEMVGDIHDSSIRLIEIVNDFLDASRLEQDKMQFDLTAFALEPLVEKVVYELGANVKDKGIHLTFDKNLNTLPLVWGDANRIKQVVYNLVGNAMKFTEKGGVNVTAKVDGKRLKVLVVDTGLGISPEGQQLLFHKFQQTGSSILTRDVTRGTGLGLYISKLLIEHMDGTVELEHSEVGKGSTFSFTLPLATKAQQKAIPSKPATSAEPTVERAAINPVSRDEKAPSSPDKKPV